MQTIVLQQPRRLFFGPGCAAACAEELALSGRRRLFVVTGTAILPVAEPVLAAWRKCGAQVFVCDLVNHEPDIALFERVLAGARTCAPDAIVGFGGGSALDVAKLVAALLDSTEDVRRLFGIGLLKSRSTFLACIPTTAGTGSEVSPIAVLLDAEEKLKKGVVSPHLVPDVSFVDPALTLALPAAITAAPGFDALVHCMEAYANRNAHPMVDSIALEGIKLIGGALERAVHHGGDLDARTAMMRGALYGGMCLGPVNTAAVHALAYPLGGAFNVAHGVANSLLTPHVFRFNLPAAPKRYAEIAEALGVGGNLTDELVAEHGLARLVEISRNCGIPQRLRDVGVPEDSLEWMAGEAMKVTRLLRNNPREMTAADAEAIYRAAY